MQFSRASCHFIRLKSKLILTDRDLITSQVSVSFVSDVDVSSIRCHILTKGKVPHVLN